MEKSLDELLRDSTELQQAQSVHAVSRAVLEGTSYGNGGQHQRKFLHVPQVTVAPPLAEGAHENAPAHSVFNASKYNVDLPTKIVVGRGPS